MKRAFALMLALAALPVHAAEQCVWPFRTSPAELATRMRAELGTNLQSACPIKTRIAVTFLLPTGKTPRRIVVDAPDCHAAEAPIARWLKDRPLDEFMPFDQPQAVAFKIALRFTA